MRVSDLYDLLAAYRLRCLSRERATFRSFNLCRAAVLSYLRFAFRDQRALWREITEQIRPAALSDRIHVAGSKTPAADRVIPRIDCPVKHSIHARSCAQVIARVTNRQHEPRDLRRSYARLLADAGIPEYRQAAYMATAPEQ